MEDFQCFIKNTGVYKNKSRKKKKEYHGDPSVFRRGRQEATVPDPTAAAPPPHCRCLCRGVRASRSARSSLRRLSPHRPLAPGWPLPPRERLPAPWGFLPARLAPTQPPQHLSWPGVEEGPDSASAAERSVRGTSADYKRSRRLLPSWFSGDGWKYQMPADYPAKNTYICH